MSGDPTVEDTNPLPSSIEEENQSNPSTRVYVNNALRDGEGPYETFKAK